MTQLDAWKSLLERFASAAGFVERMPEQVEGAAALPGTAVLWQATYAKLLIMPVDGTEVSLLQHAKIGQEWLDVSCMYQEAADHKVMDAYLLLVSSTPVATEVLQTVRDIELDPTACRKHVAWPLAGDNDEMIWRRLLRVTALGLPHSPAASGMTNTPTLHSEFEIQLLNDVKQLKGKAGLPPEKWSSLK